MFVVVEVLSESASPQREKVHTWGPYADKREAEQARRRIHLENRLAASGSWVRLPKTYVSEVTK